MGGMKHDEAVSCVMHEFPDVFKPWWKPHADCEGIPAQDRAKWLMENKGLSVEAAREEVRREFPSVFGSQSTGHHVDGRIPHTLSLVQTPDGPKLKFAVTPRNPEHVSLVAFHYQIN